MEDLLLIQNTVTLLPYSWIGSIGNICEEISSSLCNIVLFAKVPRENTELYKPLPIPGNVLEDYTPHHIDSMMVVVD